MITDEFEIIQNRILCTHILHDFVKYHVKYNPLNFGPSLPFVFPVLPMILHKETVYAIRRKQFIEGSLIKALNESPSITLGLQDRMQHLSEKTFKSLSLCFSSNLLGFDSHEGRVIPVDNRNLVPLPKISQEYQNMLKATWRLGAWFGLLGEEEILKYLDINF